MTPFKASFAAVFALTGAVAASDASAQTQQDWRSAKEVAPAATPLVLAQSYHGTKPGEGNALPRVEEIKGREGNWVTWPGFMMRPDSGSRLFVQTTRALEYEKVVKKNRIRLRFKDTQVFLDNNRNPLVTMNFNTPLRSAYLKRDKKSVQLVMDLKVASDVVITQAADADGFCYLFVDFPVGQFETGGEWHPQLSSGGGAYSPTSLSRPAAQPFTPGVPTAAAAATPTAVPIPAGPPATAPSAPAAPPPAAQPAPAAPAPSEPPPAEGPREEPPAQDPDNEIFTGE